MNYVPFMSTIPPSSYVNTYLFLLHQFGIGAVVYDVLAKDGGTKDIIYLFRIDVFELPIQDKIVAIRAEIDRRLSAE